MTPYYINEILQTQAFDTILQTLYWVILWAFVIHRLNRMQNNNDEFQTDLLNELEKRL